MPSLTYHNLPAEKQERILQAAIDEFAQYRFRDASINRIIKAAGIPRGSFYQYFKDKEDLYLLVLQKISAEKISVYANHPPPDPDATFFEAALASLPAMLDWVECCPKYNQIGMLMLQDDDEFTRWIAGNLSASHSWFVERLEKDREKGFLREDANPALVAQTLAALIPILLREYYSHGKDETIQKLKDIFELLGNGILAREGHYGKTDCSAG